MLIVITTKKNSDSIALQTGYLENLVGIEQKTFSIIFAKPMFITE